MYQEYFEAAPTAGEVFAMRVPIYDGAIGLDNRTPAHRIEWHPESGFAALECCENFAISKTGEAVTMGGYQAVETGSFHSLWYGKKPMQFAVVAKDRTGDTALYRIDVSKMTGDVSLPGIRSGLAKGKKFSYARHDSNIFYSNGVDYGVIKEDGNSYPWITSTWYDEDSIAQFRTVFPGDVLCYNAGRIYFTKGDILYWTQYGMFGIYDAARNYQRFPGGSITALAKATDGLYVSTGDGIFFMSGLNPHKWSQRHVADYKIYRGGISNEYINPIHLNLETGLPSLVAATEIGPALLLPGGTIVPLVDKVVAMPECATDEACACLVDGHSLILQTGEG